MKERRSRQPELFDPAIPQVELPMTRRVEALALLGLLLIEAITAQGEATAIHLQEVGHDQDHG